MKGASQMRQWEKRGTRTLAETRIFSLHQSRVVNPRTGGELDAFTLHCPEWVNVIALTSDGAMVLVRQYRHGIERVTLEIPGGMVDPGETPEEAGVRELLEETGYSPQGVVNLGYVDAQPAFQDNRCHTFLLTGCKRTAGLSLDNGEDLSVELVPESEVPELTRRGEISHGLVLAAFHLYHLWKSAG